MAEQMRDYSQGARTGMIRSSIAERQEILGRVEKDFPEYDKEDTVPTENLDSHNVETLLQLLANSNDEIRHALIRRESIRITLLKKMAGHNGTYEVLDTEFRKSMSPEVEEGISRGERY